eukprot:gene13310-9147_t
MRLNRIKISEPGTAPMKSAFSVPPHFAMVEKGIYRSAYPDERHIPWLRHIGIKTVVLLSVEVLPSPVRTALLHDGSGTPDDPQRINVINVSNLDSWAADPLSSGNDFSQADVLRALELAVRLEYHPLLLACPTGELQTSVVVGCLRRHEYRCFASILAECEAFLSPRCALRPSLVAFIASWNPAAFSLHAGTADDHTTVESLAAWYLDALAYRRRMLDQPPSSPSGDGARPPHEAYAGVRNPPSLSPLSSFNPKLSLQADPPPLCSILYTLRPPLSPLIPLAPPTSRTPLLCKNRYRMKSRRPARSAAGPKFDLHLPVDSRSEVQVQNKKTDDITTFLIDGSEALESPMITTGTHRSASGRLGAFPGPMAAAAAAVAPAAGPAPPPPAAPASAPAPAPQVLALGKKLPLGEGGTPAAGPSNGANPQFFHVGGTNLFVLVDGISMFYEGKSTYTGSIDPTILQKMADKELRRRKHTGGGPMPCEGMDSVEMAIRDIESAVSPSMKAEPLPMSIPSSAAKPPSKLHVQAAFSAQKEEARATNEAFRKLFDGATPIPRPLFRNALAVVPVLPAPAAPTAPPAPLPPPTPCSPSSASFSSNTADSVSPQMSPVVRHKHNRVDASGSLAFKKKAKKSDISLESIGQKNDSVELDEVTFRHQIGSGSQGTVSMVELNKKYYAMKHIDVSAVTATPNSGERHGRKRGLIRELEMIRQQNENQAPQNLIRMFNAVVKKNEEREDLYLLMELMRVDLERISKMVDRVGSQEAFKIAQMTFKEYMSGDRHSKPELDRLQKDLRGSSKHVCGRMNFAVPELWETKEERQSVFPEIVLSLFAADVLVGLKELHDDYHLVHCDLKPGNVLLSYDREHFKIADFGCSRAIDPQTLRVVSSGLDFGTMLYKAPERFTNVMTTSEGEEVNFSAKADVWSLGIMLLELSGGIHPCHPFKTEYWKYNSNLKLSKMIKPLNWTDGLFDFILRCTFVQEEERWSVSQLLKHPFIARYRNVPRRRLATFMSRLEQDSANIHQRKQCAWLEEQIRISCYGTNKINYKRQSCTLWREFTSFLPREAPSLKDRTVYPELRAFEVFTTPLIVPLSWPSRPSRETRFGLFGAARGVPPPGSTPLSPSYPHVPRAVMAGGSKEKKGTGVLVVGTSSLSRQPIIERTYAGQFEVVFLSPEVDEKAIRSPDALQLTRRIAEAKMESVLHKIDKDEELVKKLQASPVSMVVTFDQVVVWGNEIREKPFDNREAKKFLLDYSNSTVSTVMTTVVSNFHTRKQSYRQNTTRTYYNEISHRKINNVIERGRTLSAAGGFVVEDPDLQTCMVKIDPGTMEEVQGFCVRAVTELLAEINECNDIYIYIYIYIYI